MEFIILRKEKRTYHIENADTPLEAVKQYVSYYFSGDIKPFTVLCNNGEMNLKELVAYANQHLLCAYTEIEGIHVLGVDCLTETTCEVSAILPGFLSNNGIIGEKNSGKDFEGASISNFATEEDAIRKKPWAHNIKIGTRAYNCLSRCGIGDQTYTLAKNLATIGDVADLTTDEIHRIRNLGSETCAEIAYALRKAGITRSAWFKFEKHKSEST